jgi:hypothetical protein
MSQHTLGAGHLSTDVHDSNKEVAWGNRASLVCGAVFLEHGKTLQFDWDWGWILQACLILLWIYVQCGAPVFEKKRHPDTTTVSVGLKRVKRGTS